MIEPVHPSQRCELNSLNVSPRALLSDQFGLVQSIDRLGECIVVGITDAADRRFNTGLIEPVGVADRYVLRTSITVVDQARVFIDASYPTALPPVRYLRFW